MAFPNFVFYYLFKVQFRNRYRVNVELKKFTLAKSGASCAFCALGIVNFVSAIKWRLDVSAVKWRLGLKRRFNC